MTTKYELQYIDMMRKCKSYRKCQKITQSEVADDMNEFFVSIIVLLILVQKYHKYC